MVRGGEAEKIGNIIHKYFDKLFDPKVVEGLRERYAFCDETGHKKPNNNDNYCDFCFRRLVYDSSPEVKSILKDREKLNFLDVPMDAPILFEKRKQYLASQKGHDRLDGLNKLRLEMKL